MILNEVVKSFLRQPEKEELSSDVKSSNVLSDLSANDNSMTTGSFFDDDQYQSSFYGKEQLSDITFKQKQRISKYRQLSMTPDITDAIDEIVNEIVFSYDDRSPLKININEENEAIVKAITEKFNRILKLANIKRNAFNIIRSGYVDGQLVMHCAYDKKNPKNGIQSLKLIDPCMLYLEGNEYKYMSEDKIRSNFNTDDTKTYSIEEIVREDFGLYDGKIILGYLEYAIKPANILKTLEDLLIPLRFSRSISRRVFNVDIGDLPSKRGEAVMKEHQSKFKYKKFYNNETGEVTNQQHITSMVEDYWFSNRSGGKGTSVDVLDESGNLGELGDILYFSKKLYRALKIPSNRIPSNEEGDSDFGYDETRVSKEDLKFFMFVSRLRQVYSNFFKEILKRECISTGILSESEWDEKEELINITFAQENKFIEKMKLDNFTSKLDIYSTAQEYQGKLFSVETILSDVFRMSKDEIEDEFKKIQKESKDPLYKTFYEEDDGY